jgi:hypothetical protein
MFLETNFKGYSVTKLYDTLKSINPSQQHALAGLDEFITDGVEAWNVLKGKFSPSSLSQLDQVKGA